MAEQPGGFDHEPVMVRQIAEVFGVLGDGLVVDATVGGAGHAKALLDACGSLDVIGLDQDAEALAAAARALDPYLPRARLRQARFDQLHDVLTELGVDEVAGVLFDLGVSSPQLDRAERGFSYRGEGPLDMRMDQRAELRASHVVNGYPQATLGRVLREYGDERYASRIAAAIVTARPIETTTQLADIVRAAIPAAARRRGGHPAKRTFQAIRMEVNDERAVLEAGLTQAVDALAPEGRIAVLSYHSGEDRVAKAVLREAETGGCTCPAQLPCVCGAEPVLRLLWRGTRTPDPDEVTRNPRSSSARLRAAERVGGSSSSDRAA